jgi:hypothetical protein
LLSFLEAELCLLLHEIKNRKLIDSRVQNFIMGENYKNKNWGNQLIIKITTGTSR